MTPAAIGRHAAMTARSRRTAFGQASEPIELSHQTMTSTDAVAWNRAMDASLASTGVVDQEVFRRFLEAHDHDAASTAGWLEAKLQVLQARLVRGGTLTVHAPPHDDLVAITAPEDLASWVAKYFPSARLR